VVGESPKRYLTRTRLAHAATLLYQTDGSLAEIALQIGYGSEFSFAKAFKRTFGIAPGTYRGQRHGVPGLGRDPDAAILTQDASGSLSVRFGHPS
jgi:transcriptional regulator GlxA family with amidase domain